MRELPGSLFTRGDARRAGLSDPAISRAARHGRITVVRRGIFTEGAVDPILAARAAAIACGGSVISHRAAALMHGIALLHPPPPRPDLTVDPGGTGDVKAALLHRATIRPEDVVHLDGVDVTSAARTAIDLARTVSLGAAVVSLDSALNKKLTTRGELEAVIARCSGWPGIRRARAAYALADPNAESPLESASRLVIARLGLPAPKTQATFVDEHGQIVGQSDFYWDAFGVFGEADGRAKYRQDDDDDQLKNPLYREKIRQEDLEDLALIGVRWGWVDVRYRQPVLRQRILNAFERGRRRDASGFPRNWSVIYP